MCSPLQRSYNPKNIKLSTQKKLKLKKSQKNSKNKKKIQKSKGIIKIPKNQKMSIKLKI